MNNPSKIQPLDFDFLADYLKYWKNLESDCFKLDIFKKVRIYDDQFQSLCTCAC